MGRSAQARLFFAAYFGVVFLILFWNLFHCTSVTWLTRDAFLAAEADPDSSSSQTAGTAVKGKSGGAGGTAAVLLDGEPLVMFSPLDSTPPQGTARGTIPAKARLRGVGVHGYENDRGLRFTEETVCAEVLDASTKEVLGSGTLFLKNQSPYPNDETSVYIAFEHPVEGTAGKELELRISSAGLVRTGISFSGSVSDGEENAPAAGLYYEKKTWNPLTAILYFLAEMAVGLGGLLLYGERIFPLFEKTGGGQEVPAGTLRGRKIAGSLKGRDFLPLAAVLLLCLVCMGTAWLRAVRKVSDTMDAEVLVRTKSAEETVTLRTGQAVRQRIIPGQNGLAGLGICLADGEDPAGGQVLGWKVLNADGTEVLGEGQAALSALKKVKTALEKDLEDEEILQAAGKYLLLPLDSVIRTSSGKEYLLELTAGSAGDGDGGEAVGNAAAADDGDDGEAAGNADAAKVSEDGSAAGSAAGSIRLLASVDTNGGLQIRNEEGEEESRERELCLLAAYRNNGFMKGFFLWGCVVLLVSLAGVYVLCRFAENGFGASVATVYLVSALSMGLLFSFVTPAYTISDERTHIDSVYLLSNRLLGITDVPGPKRAYKRACDIDAAIANTMPIKAVRYRAVAEDLFGAAEAAAPEKAVPQAVGAGTEGSDAGLGVPLPASGKELTAAYTRSALDNVPVLCYLPAAVGFSIGRLAGRNMITMVMFARWANLLACAAVMYFAIRRLPRGGACLAVIGLFPKTLQQTASCSYDGLIIAGTFLFISYCGAAAGESLLPGLSGGAGKSKVLPVAGAAGREEKLAGILGEDPHRICIRDLMILVLASFFVASCKGGVYLPVLGLALLLPFAGGQGRSFSKKMRAGLAAAVLGGAGFLFFGKFVFRLISMFSRQSGSASIAAGTKTLYTLSDLLRAPAKLVRIYYNTLDIRGDGLLGELVGKNLCQKWVFVFAFLFIAFLGILEEGSRRKETGSGGGCGTGLRLSVRLWLLFLTAASTALVFLSMLLAFTEKGAAYVDGLQGRYFLPVVPLCFLAAQTVKLRREGIKDQWLVYAADVLLAVTISQIFLAYLGSI